jgi:hypothetical protein
MYRKTETAQKYPFALHMATIDHHPICVVREYQPEVSSCCWTSWFYTETIPSGRFFAERTVTSVD